MRAIGFDTYGGPEVLHEVELPDPRPGPGEILVRVDAAGVAPVDAMARSGGLAALYEGITPPYVPGMDVCGVVEEVGEGASGGQENLAVGARVVAFVAFSGSRGGYSEAVVVPAVSAVRAPANATPSEAVAFLLNALTARNSLDALALPPGATVLVTGAAGSVGGYITQLAYAEGLHVIALAGAGDESLVRGFGAEDFIPRGADVVAEARAVLAGRGIALETEGLELLEADAVPPGVRRQLVRVLGELVSNMVKHAAPGSARLLIEADGRSLEAMASNASGPGHRDERRGEWQGRSAVISSGLGLAGAQRRVEALSGTFDVTRTTERFTAVLSVPLRAAAPG